MSNTGHDRTHRYLELVSGRRTGLAAGIQRALLRAASWTYRAVTWTRNRAFEHGWKKVLPAPVPVISVGNLTVGGTGKTPCVEYVARFLSEGGHRVAILSRGYGASEAPNDEALVLEENLPDVPHLQGADRVELARLAVEELESDVLVLDDGFQHRRLARNLDLVLIDATNAWGHGYLLPRGLLRESPRELCRAQAVILTRCDLVSADVLAAIRNRVRRLAPAALMAESIHRPVCLINSAGETRALELPSEPVAAFCGLGNPDAFRASLERIGLAPAQWRIFPDHHPYTRADVESLEEWAAGLPAGGFVLTTQKDLVKLRVARLAERPLWALKIELQITKGEKELRELIARAVS